MIKLVFIKKKYEIFNPYVHFKRRNVFLNNRMIDYSNYFPSQSNGELLTERTITSICIVQDLLIILIGLHFYRLNYQQEHKFTMFQFSREWKLYFKSIMELNEKNINANASWKVHVIKVIHIHQIYPKNFRYDNFSHKPSFIVKKIFKIFSL